jgi:hypothetical protein
MPSSGMLRRVDLVRTDVSEELSASLIRMTRIGELGTTLAVTSNRRPLPGNAKWASNRTYKTIILLVVLNECGTWSLTLREEQTDGLR